MTIILYQHYSFKKFCTSLHTLYQGIFEYRNTSNLFDYKMIWEHYIDKLTVILCSICFIFRQIRNSFTMDIPKIIFLSQFNLFTFRLFIQGNSSQMNKVFVIQKKILPQKSCKQLFKDLSLLANCFIILLVHNSPIMWIKPSHDYHKSCRKNIHPLFSMRATGRQTVTPFEPKK